MTRALTQPEMAEHDKRQFTLMNQRMLTMGYREQSLNAAHRMAGDKRSRGGWDTSDAEVIRYLRNNDPRAAELLAVIEGYDLEITELSRQVGEMEAFYRNDPWNRYFPCLNRDGHIHSTLRGCKTVYWDTDMGWATEYSGLTPDQAIHGIPGQFEGLGETLCSVCFPDAPVEWCRTRSEVTRAERERAAAEKRAARDAIKAMKELAEPFRTWDNDRITTVAAAKGIIRRPAETQVELEWNQTEQAAKRWQDRESYEAFIARMKHRLEMERADAARMSLILIEREFALAGSGWSQADQDKAFTTALKRNRSIWFK